MYIEGITFFVRRLIRVIVGRNLHLLGLDSSYPTSHSVILKKINFSYISDRESANTSGYRNQNSAFDESLGTLTMIDTLLGEIQLFSPLPQVPSILFRRARKRSNK